MNVRKRLRPSGVIGLPVLLGIVASCSGAPEPEPLAEGGEIVVQLLRQPVAVPAFSVTNLDGETMSSADWRGKVVLVNFWATWCPPCLAEIPDLVRLQEKYRDELLIIGVSEDDPHVDLKAFARERGMNYPIVRSTPELQAIFPGVIALPTTFILDREGLMAKKHVGLLNARETEATTRALAGMALQNARVERVDDPSRLSAESAAQITEIPGVDLASVPSASKIDAILELNESDCTCGCGLSVAKCRIDDPACPVSLPLAQTILAKFAGPGTP